ncbi:hypothetical protein JOC85_000250 [Bacillus mesophilus]|uniref:Methylthioribose kinase n=1 Tax=Bacillus mesophilus TaxID=1808955 RepID=A0A6M0Q260_9BACI|nr:methylthioribose kinase [Bacillus mesophilus]MBM7659483.1 hypothetical protein [Bacillus mesophilus]NEY70356.1 methylthioribose kinase [Bacillus mesophilus]
MIQRFIELGEGYSDIYELLEIATSNQHRIKHLVALHTTKDDKQMTSLAVVLHPAETGKFQPIYICREGIPLFEEKKSQRLVLFETLSNSLEVPVITFKIKPSTAFAEKELYYQYVIGILRLHHIIPPLS